MNPVLTIYLASILFLTMPTSKMQDDSHSQEKPIITFGVVADVQYADNNPGASRYYRGSIAKLREAVAQFKNDSAEFIVSMGDLIDKNYESFRPVLDILESSGLKTYHITGNHDYSVNNNQKNQLPLLSPTGERYYSFSKNSFRLIFLDGNDVSLYGASSKKTEQEAVELLTLMKSKGEKNALEWNGGIGSIQFKWLANELTIAEKNKEKVFLFCHFPIAPDNAHNLLNSRELLELLAKYPGVLAWFAGHNHEGNYVKTGSTFYVTFRGMVETENENSFAMVKVFRNRIEIKGYGREASRVLEY
jgi:manganese-dependent ADP-ribose/CDP-alcohol diphosphatase